MKNRTTAIFTKLLFCFGGAFFLPNCSSLYFFPSRESFSHPSKNGIKTTSFFLSSKNGKKIEVWRLWANTPFPKNGIVVQFHGNGENMSSHFISVSWLAEYGYDVYTFDYQGYGNSEGNPSISNAIHDSHALLEYVVKETENHLPIAIVGQSLGGAIAAYILSQNDSPRIKSLILDSSFSSYREMVRQIAYKSVILYPLAWPISWFFDNTYAPSGVSNKIFLPILYFHDRFDPVVPFDQGVKLFDAFHNSLQKEFFALNSGTHVASFFISEAAREKVLNFLTLWNNSSTK